LPVIAFPRLPPGRVSRAAAEDALETRDERRIAQRSAGAFRGTQRIESALVMRTGPAGEVRDTAENWAYVHKPVILALRMGAHA